MKNEIQLRDAGNLATLDNDTDLTEEQCWSIAFAIELAESDVRLAKGKLWNKCTHGTRVELCDYFDWNYETLKQYGLVVAAFPDMRKIGAHLTFTHYREVVKYIRNQEDRVKLLDEACAHNESSRDFVKRLLVMRGEQREKEAEESDKAHKEKLYKKYGWEYGDDGKLVKGGQYKDGKPVHVRDEEIRIEEEKVKYQRDKIRARSENKALNIMEACEFFGLPYISWIEKKTLDYIYRGYSRMYHTDTGKGDAIKMQQLNECKALLDRIATNSAEEV